MEVFDSIIHARCPRFQQRGKHGICTSARDPYRDADEKAVPLVEARGDRDEAGGLPHAQSLTVRRNLRTPTQPVRRPARDRQTENRQRGIDQVDPSYHPLRLCRGGEGDGVVRSRGYRVTRADNRL